MKYLIPLLFLLLSIDASSQSSLNLSLGPSIPVGSFASKNGFSPTAGLANIGAAAAIEYDHSISHTHFSWTASLRGQFNGVSKSATEAPFETQFAGYQWSMNNSYWTSIAALIGASYEWPLTPKLSAQIKLAAGIAGCWSPKQNITGIRDSAGFGATDLVEASLKSVNTTTFTALAGIGIAYKWRPRWSLTARIDYDWLKPTFKNVTPQIVWARNLIVSGILSPSNARQLSAFSSAHDYTQPMPSLGVTVGITRTL